MADRVCAVPQDYGVGRWGEGYFGINARGHATVCPDPDNGVEIDLHGLALELRGRGLRPPVLVRFNDLLRHRVRALCGAFDAAAERLRYRGGYRAVYPLKVNQQRSVIEQLVAARDRVGLEAGSKPELLAALAAAPSGGVVVCNGYKDREYVRLALIGLRLGYAVHIVIEKPSELELVLAESADLGIEPLLGVRVRLAAIAAGKWQNSGGSRSKFGLTAAQLLQLVDSLREHGCLHWLVLLHAHIGSQISDLADVRCGVQEVARYYAELRRLGAPLATVDVGGGLGVDYEGSHSRALCSVDYGLDDYAAAVLEPLARACAEQGLQHPCVFSESGRALTAHHAVLITDVVERETQCADPPADAPADDALLVQLRELANEVGTKLSPRLYETASRLLADVHARFAQGDMGLAQRAHAETLFYSLAQSLQAGLMSGSLQDPELRQQLDDLLADRVFCNFSLFQSVPDAWAIGQVFPVMPLHCLDQPAERAALIHDLTCDSDGTLGRYVAHDGVRRNLPLHAPRPGEPYLLGIFMVGAYQEILGDMHNLFGDTDAVNVWLEADGRHRIGPPEHGDMAAELLSYVHFDPEAMLGIYSQRLRSQEVDERLVGDWVRELRAGLFGNTYLTSG